VLRGTRLSYPTPSGDIAILKGIDLTVAAGETVAVTGPSGSGKSSLIAVMAGLESPTGGSTEILGLDMGAASEQERTHLRRRDIGVVFQSYHLVPTMTALQNVSLPLVLAGIQDAENRAAGMLDRMGLSHRLTHRPAALSGGEQQRVAIARAFVAEPGLVLADEPTGNLDQETGDIIAEAMFSLTRDSGAAMVLVTHDRDLAARCDRTVAIDAGRIAG
jgi:putative ABC transport system ATP-binding protein